MKLRELLEALTPGQKKYVDDKLSSSDLVYNPNQWDNIFGDHEWMSGVLMYSSTPLELPIINFYSTMRMS